MDQGHHKRLWDHTHIQYAGRTSVARLHDRTPVRCAERTPARQCMCATETNISSGGDKSIRRANQVIGLPRTIFTACG
jgi:hypothetical protein